MVISCDNESLYVRPIVDKQTSCNSGPFKKILPYYEIIVLKSFKIGPQSLLPARKPLMAKVNSHSRYNFMSYIRASSACLYTCYSMRYIDLFSAVQLVKTVRLCEVDSMIYRSCLALKIKPVCACNILGV